VATAISFWFQQVKGYTEWTVPSSKKVSTIKLTLSLLEANGFTVTSADQDQPTHPSHLMMVCLFFALLFK
jgi:hypothetical protein